MTDPSLDAVGRIYKVFGKMNGCQKELGCFAEIHGAERNCEHELLGTLCEYQYVKPTDHPKHFAVWDEDSDVRGESGSHSCLGTCYTGLVSHIDIELETVLVVWLVLSTR